MPNNRSNKQKRKHVVADIKPPTVAAAELPASQLAALADELAKQPLIQNAAKKAAIHTLRNWCIGGFLTLFLCMGGVYKQAYNQINAHRAELTSRIETNFAQMSEELGRRTQLISNRLDTNFNVASANLKEQTVAVSDRLNVQFNGASEELDKQLRLRQSLLSTQIFLKLQEPNVRQAIKEVTEEQAIKLMTDNVAPALSLFSNKLTAATSDFTSLFVSAQSGLAMMTNQVAGLRESLLFEIMAAQAAIERLNTNAELYALVVSALADDRRAFDKLLGLYANPPDASTGQLIYRFLISITDKVTSDVLYASQFRQVMKLSKSMVIDWSKTKIDPSTASYDDFQTFIDTNILPGERANAIIEACEQANRINNRKQQLQFLLHEMKSENSIFCVWTICSLLHNETNNDHTMLAYPEWIRYIEDKLDTLK